MFLIFDTETTGLPRDWKAPLTDYDNWPRLVQLAWQIRDIKGNLIKVKDYIIKPDGFEIPFNSQKIHGISTEIAIKNGYDLKLVLDEFDNDLKLSRFIIGHNVDFDNSIVGCEFHRNNMENILQDFPKIDTMKSSVDFCKIPGGRGGSFKYPSLTDLHKKLFGDDFKEAHNAAADVDATSKCFLELLYNQVIPNSIVDFTQEQFKQYSSNYLNVIKSFDSSDDKEESVDYIDKDIVVENDLEIKKKEISKEIKSSFSHLHLHSQYSILQASTNINELVNKAVEMNMPTVAITDLNNMYGVFKFLNTVLNHEVNQLNDGGTYGLKPIIGCEISVCMNHEDKDRKDHGFQQVLLCKDKKGYQNLSKLSSISYLKGFYYIPRIDKRLLLEFKDGLIALTGSIYGEIPKLILNEGENKAEQEFIWWKENFGDDFYVELIRHGLEEEKYVNTILLKFAKKHNVKVIAANNVFYLNKSDAKAHDVLLCVKDGEIQSTPKGKGRGFRYALPNDEFYFKSQDEMKELFSDIPEAIDNISEIVDKIEVFKLNRDVLLPAFDIPEEFIHNDDKIDGGKRGENAYLRHLTFQGAKQRYKEITEEINERIEFELKTIEESGYPGYFLIVADFINQARKMDVSVGPGRGSAAGSVVAYCTKITNVDPIKYDLLFERFLNPERVSLPDIDIDFDDEGRSRVIDWVVHKYGYDQVSQIITYGTMAAKSSIRDTARVLDLPLDQAGKIANLVPDMLSLRKLFNLNEKDIKKNINSEQISSAKQLIELEKTNGVQSQTVKLARKLEGSVRNTGTHACGVIITPKPLTDLIPMTTSKDAELLVTQYDNSVVESAGLLKMDFLGLKNLTIIKDCVKIIKQIHGVSIDIDNLPLDDNKTYEVFQRGNTIGIFQFSSAGMRKYLRMLKPDKFEDLIAMNALYRPGPMQYIPDFINRKHGKTKVSYDLPEMEEYLKETYGITVFQEQVMLLSQKLGNFSKGEADILRKGMGKKNKSVVEKMKPKFLDGCRKNELDTNKVEKVWKDWEKFAEYAFNKSHSTCYSLIAYQTAYLKAHYPAELMAALLTSNMNDIKDVTLNMEECRSMGVNVLGPDVNESFYKFAVNNNGEIRFGLGAIKGVGESAVDSIVNERKENGNYKSLEDFVQRIDLKSANKRTLESLALAGGFDSFNLYRSQLFALENDTTYLEKMMKFGSKYQLEKKSPQIDIFGKLGDDTLSFLKPPQVDPWSTMNLLTKEKEVVGVYISGHPLDDFRLEIDNFVNSKLDVLKDMQSVKSRDLRFAVVVSEVEHRESQNGNKYAVVHIEDYVDSYKLFLFGRDYTDNKNLLNEGWLLYITGKVQNKRWGNTEELEFKLNKINMLDQLMDMKDRILVLEMSYLSINPQVIDQLVSNISKHKGNHQVEFKFINYNDKYSVDLLSRKNKVKINKYLFEDLNKINDIKLSIKS